MILTSLLAISSLLTLARATPMSFTTYRRRELPVDEGAELVLLYDQKGFENADPSPGSVYDLERDYANEMAALQYRQPEMSEVGTSETAVGEDASVLAARSAAARGGKKRAIGSLSIVNPVDVLRSRVLLELARRRVQQQQRQVAENRRILETIGKRSVHQLTSNPNGYNGGNSVQSANNAGVIYAKAERGNVRVVDKQRDDQTNTQRVPIGVRSRDWYETDDDVDDDGVNDDDDDDDDAVVMTRGNGDENNTRKAAATYRQDRI